MTVWLVALEVDDGFAVEGLREQVDRCDLDGGEGALLDKALEVAGHSCRVAAHVGDITGARTRDEVDGLGREACTRRVDHQDVGVLIGELAHRVAADDVDVIELVDLQVATQVAHGRAVGLDGGDKIAAARERQGKVPAPQYRSTASSSSCGSRASITSSIKISAPLVLTWKNDGADKRIWPSAIFSVHEPSPASISTLETRRAFFSPLLITRTMLVG